MPGLHKGVSTQCTTQQQFTKPRHQPSERDQQARDRLRNKISESKAKIKRRAYLQLGEKALQLYIRLIYIYIFISVHTLNTTLSDYFFLLLLYIICIYFGVSLSFHCPHLEVRNPLGCTIRNFQ